MKALTGFVLPALTTLLVGCAQERFASFTQTIPDAGASSGIVRAGTYRLLYSFKGGAGGSNPLADLLEVGGKLYGTTMYGGRGACVTGEGCGTIFQFDPSGSYRVLHSFQGAPHDGAFPEAGMILVGGILYGTTAAGAATPSSSSGTVYETSTSGQEKTLYSFAATGDGEHPTAELVEDRGMLYGTTELGGRLGCYSDNTCGTVFVTSLTGKEKVLHDFVPSVPPKDGIWPLAGLTTVDGRLYGTTGYGGTSSGGTVFEVSTAGKEVIRHDFTGRHDGAYPFSQLTLLKGELYGTTWAGGAYGLGSVFAISPSGKERVVYSFKGSPDDGSLPESRLIVVNGGLYGTTSLGGSHQCFSNGTGCGTVFEVTLSGKETVLHSFAGDKDGASPRAGLVSVNGMLFGTTSVGGTGKCAATKSSLGGCGTIFSITP
jgi:uncharacterized repeat protein (TIGR03803 family)